MNLLPQRPIIIRFCSPSPAFPLLLLLLDGLLHEGRLGDLAREIFDVRGDQAMELIVAVIRLAGQQFPVPLL